MGLINNPQIIYATIFCKSFYRDGDRTRVELVPVHILTTQLQLPLCAHRSVYIVLACSHMCCLCTRCPPVSQYTQSDEQYTYTEK